MTAFSHRCVWGDASKQGWDNVAADQDIAIYGTVACEATRRHYHKMRSKIKGVLIKSRSVERITCNVAKSPDSLLADVQHG